MSILVINAGSSSLKFGLFDVKTFVSLASGLIDWAADPRRADFIILSGCAEEVRSQVEVQDYIAAVSHILRSLTGMKLIFHTDKSPIKAVGHRVVHGGTVFRESVLIDKSVKSTIKRLIELAPLHNTPALKAIEAVEEALPGIPQVAVFDTALYANMPRKAIVYPLPYEWYTDWGIRRFGFHGISHSYCASRAAELMGKDLTRLRIVSCHLGNGCSATATHFGVPVATTMGFTPMDGLMMGTRPGSVDPGILLYIQQHKGLSAEQIDHVLNHDSGLLGISGVSSDFRKVEEAEHQGDERARLALEIYACRVREAIGALTVTMGGIDVLVFTAGVGENSASLRATVCDGLECLGLMLDIRSNTACQPDVNIAMHRSPAQILVIHTREDLMIAREVSRITQ